MIRNFLYKDAQSYQAIKEMEAGCDRAGQREENSYGPTADNPLKKRRAIISRSLWFWQSYG
jgi:hypothetical protein